MTPAELILAVLAVAGAVFIADVIRARRRLEHDAAWERDMALAHILDAYYTRDGIPR